ncbi:hypothetical protein FUU19_21680 [Serratia sp. Lou2A]|uniref:ATP-binding protein n=1 Tax=Serratia montpellierensis TaxID=2598730 RepID=A0ABS8J204_9GAMM|nr:MULTISPECIES: hypothetical protein [unclassified Serratia (in: enterobacteria)]MCC7586097.1 hypothetical protein [Serratia sp. Lou2A]MCC7657954.1 hypothetical protein [Serratia sp. Pon4B]HAT3683891.1 hypothetical protein [Serratia marcescens]
MADFFFRTEDIRPDEVLNYFVETSKDRQVVDALKNRNPVVLVGSRGVGKSFLLRVAQKELIDSIEKERVFPVYISFVRSSLLQSSDPDQFKHWMLARICSTVMRSLTKAGLLGGVPRSIGLLAGGKISTTLERTKVEEIADSYEISWKTPQVAVDVEGLPSIDDFKEALEDLADELNISRFAFLFDEAAHIFLPEQQRQFFTMFRDLRSHCITCNAAVYPGVTTFGETFQPVHDATMLTIDRDILSTDYVENMREIVQKQADSNILTQIAQNGKNFSTLAYAATGNPRLLLKTIAQCPKINSQQVNETIREFYRTDIWAEHSTLSEKYVGHRALIDWGRDFIESQVIPDIKNKNDQYLLSDKATSAFFWIHRDAPELVKEALRVLAYTGIVVEHAVGIKATRAEIGKRYLINLGCLFALESTPTSTSFEVAKELTPKRMTEYGSNHPSYRRLTEQAELITDEVMTLALNIQLERPAHVLDLTTWQLDKLSELGLNSVGDVLNATEAKLKEANYIGDIRARRMRNAAVAAVLEYLSG